MGDYRRISREERELRDRIKQINALVEHNRRMQTEQYRIVMLTEIEADIERLTKRRDAILADIARAPEREKEHRRLQVHLQEQLDQLQTQPALERAMKLHAAIARAREELRKLGVDPDGELMKQLGIDDHDE